MRIISPHLTIYKFPITAISSISNRITGIYLSLSLYGYCGFNCLNTDTQNNLFKKYLNLHDISKLINKNILLFSISYHSFGGIRHLIWDNNPKLLTKNLLMKSNYVLLTSSNDAS